MTAEERKEYNRAYRQNNREYFAQKQAEYRQRQAEKIAAMEAELAKSRERTRIANTIFGWAMSVGQKVEFVVDGEDAEEMEG